MKWICRALLSFCAVVVSGNAHSQAPYPRKPVQLVVGFPPGSQADTVARLLGQQLADLLRVPVVVDSAPGAAGNIAAERVAKAAPDGYTLGLLGEVQIAVNPSLYALPFDPVNDFVAVSQVAAYPNMLVVHNAVPVKTVTELVALAKAHPGELTFASGGAGSAPHIAAEMFKSTAGVDLRHIPYKGVVLAIPDLLGARVTMMFSPIGIVLPAVRQGKLHAIAVTSSARSPAAPGLPTIAESGYPGFEYTGWYGVLAPAKTPPAVVRRLNAEIINALARPALRAKFTELGLEPTGNSQQDFAAQIRSEVAKRAALIRNSGITAD